MARLIFRTTYGDAPDQVQIVWPQLESPAACLTKALDWLIAGQLATARGLVDDVNAIADPDMVEFMKPLIGKACQMVDAHANGTYEHRFIVVATAEGYSIYPGEGPEKYDIVK